MQKSAAQTKQKMLVLRPKQEQLPQPGTHYHPTLPEIWTYPAEELAAKRGR